MPEYTIIFTAVFLSVGLITSSMEMFFSKSIFCGNGLMNWEISKLRSQVLPKSKKLNLIYREDKFYYFSFFRLFAGILLLLSVFVNLEYLFPIAFSLVFLAYLLFTMRTPYGLDGSDQAALLVAIIYSILCASTSPIIKLSCHIFLAAQLTLVYFTSGWNKLRAKNWRNGIYLWKLFSTGFYGMEKLGIFLQKHKQFSRFSSLCVVLSETLFILFWFLPAPYCWLILGALGLFHLITAITMGLNTFIWAFLAMYPSTIYCRLLY
ncbi:MAG: hypothetical protein ACOYLT_11170 [Flavobacterium sp.]|uniref:hypothetical protein n=1 Tax=Flavobacterium sp. TaxID=239 RepID=UPI003BEE6B06